MNFLTPLFGYFAVFLAYLYSFTGNLGITIILFTILLRLALLPISLASLRSADKMRKIQPKLEKLKKKYKNKPQKMQQAQAKLYKAHNVNPLAGCLPQIVQIAVLIFLYRALLNFLGQSEINGIMIDSSFLWMDLGKPDPTFVLPFLAFATQLIFSLMIVPGGEQRDVVPNKSQSKAVQKADKDEKDITSMASSMQKQMMFVMPVVTGFFAATFPSGLALYWVTATLINVLQQWYVSGPGGLVTYSRRVLGYLGKRG